MNLELSSLWKEELGSHWKALKIEHFLSEIGVDFQTNFLQSLNNSRLNSNPYLNHTWIIQDHSQLPIGVLHAYPNQIGVDQVIWEEWFLLNGEIRHHVLSNLPLVNQDGTWQPEPTDKDNPEITLNRSWNYKIEKSLKPFLL
jgi:hypothetical protein